MKYNVDESTSTLIKKASQLYIRFANLHLKEFKVPHAYTPFLLQLWTEDGQTQAVLHKKIGIEQPTAVRTLDRMERDQFIKRERCPKDRRIIKIHLTKKSKDLHGSLTRLAKSLNNLALEGLNGEERKTLNRLLRATILNLEKNLGR